MPALDVNSTVLPQSLDVFSDGRAMFRAGTDIRTPASVVQDMSYRICGSYSSTERFVLATYPRAWLAAVMKSIAEYRVFKDGWDGGEALAPSLEALDTAEMLAVHLNSLDPDRIVFNVDPLGRPTFAAYEDGFYLHLTVDSAHRITWFVERDGREFFADDIEFSGRRLPDELSKLLV